MPSASAPLISMQAGNALWDCINFPDPATVRIVEALGGIAAIAISHPHYYALMGAWSRITLALRHTAIAAA